MAKAPDSRRRFVPVPIETTFEQHRLTGPAGELTPSPSLSPTSPTSAPPLPQEQPNGHGGTQKQVRVKRHFAPQLVESSIRRSRRAGDVGPATRPTDRTDITPYTKHIYAPKSRRRHDATETKQETKASLWIGPPSWRVGGRNKSQKRPSAGRRESCDDEIAGGVFNLVAKDAQRKLQEIAMAAFPNSGERIGGAEHFFVAEGSGSEEDTDQSARGRSMSRRPRRPEPSRRDSSEENVGWAVKEMQEHHEKLAKTRLDTRINSIDLDKLDLDSPPADAMWTTQTRNSLSGSLTSSVGQVGDRPVSHSSPERLRAIGESPQDDGYLDTPVFIDTYMPYIPSAPSGMEADMPFTSSSRIPPETGFGGGGYGGGFASKPLGGFRHDRDGDEAKGRPGRPVSPPLLGKDLVFRKVLSPKQTKLEPDHKWDLATGTTAANYNRDVTESNGLWHGYCWTKDGERVMIKADRPVMIHTPYPETSGDPFSAAFGGVTEEPSSLGTRSGAMSARSSLLSDQQLWQQRRRGSPVGIHMLQGLDERLRKEKAAADLEEKIVAEFDDAFITQVYNYLSLGYPAMARAYDEELSKISQIPTDELERDDEDKMNLLAGGAARGYILTAGEKGAMGKASGEGDADMMDAHQNVAAETTPPKVVVTEGVSTGSSGGSSADEEAKDMEKGPRWTALKKYVLEWARQHPDLDSMSPPIWGVRERRGSWGI